MKTIVVFFSLEGNSEYAANKILEYTGGDILELKTAKEYPKGNFGKYFLGGKSAIFGEKPKLVPYEFSKDKYDLIIIGTPVWAGTFAPPIRTFIKENDLSKKKIALYACSASGNAEKCFGKLKEELKDCNIIASLSLIEPKKKQSEENDKKIKEFCNKIEKQ